MDFIPELCCSPRQPQRGHKLCSHSLFIVFSVLQSSMVADTDGQEKRASDGVRREGLGWQFLRRGLGYIVKKSNLHADSETGR